MPAGYAGPPDRLALYERLAATIEAVERKGATMPYTARNGHMFSFLDPAGSLALRLSADDREAFLETYSSTLAEQHGRVMQEFVVVPPDLLERTDELAGWFTRSYEWIGSLKPKPTKRRPEST
jgi:hypothetical protein